MTSLKSALLALALISFAAPAVMAGNAAVKEELAAAAASAEATEQAVEAAEAAAEATPAK